MGEWGSRVCCLFCFLVTLFVISSIIFLPQEPKFTITDASLTQFNLSATNFNSNNKLLIYKLSYLNCNNLKLSLSNHNDHRENGGLNFKPSKRMGNKKRNLAVRPKQSPAASPTAVTKQVVDEAYIII
ncbi:hypothetical protein CsatA_000545 [Cannabis sativa]